jgi:hypothetical protein
MAYLTPSQRRALERTIQQARSAAETGAADALRRLGVAEPRRPDRLTETQGQLRNRLRMHARALGDPLSDGTQAIKRLTEAVAYVQWHRLLFARSLLERRLLRHPVDGGDLTLLDCQGEAASLGLADEWAAAAHYAARLLVGVFPSDDPVGAIALAPEHSRALRQHLLSLDAETFLAEDALGWTYQFWRSHEKAEINASGGKIGAAELPAMTQLFTEPYMVRFLLHNTLGAWWAGKVLEKRPELAEAAADEASLRRACSPPGYAFDMLRFLKEGERWRPAAGTFPSWPKDAKAITVLDPCCGSGHFLTEALAILVAVRQAEEECSAADSAAAVIRDNLFGLEIDGRCVQLAAFAVALAAWRLGGWQPLPLPHVAWSGAPPPLPKPQFVALADGNAELAHALAAIHDLFRHAPLLGSLIEPTGGDLIDPVRVTRVEAMLEPIIERARTAEPERAEGAIAARGMADAVAILSRHFTLQATNPPFLGRGRQVAVLADYLKAKFENAKNDLATAMLVRMLARATPGGTVAVVTPQNWLFLGGYKGLRTHLLQTAQLNSVVNLGPAAFQDMNWWAIQTALTTWTASRPLPNSLFLALDADTGRDLNVKPEIMRSAPARMLEHAFQLQNPDSRISIEIHLQTILLSNYAEAYQGNTTGDNDRYIRQMWEFDKRNSGWCFLQRTPEDIRLYGGRDRFMWWGTDGTHVAHPQASEAVGRGGVAIRQIRSLAATVSDGDRFEMNVGLIVPRDPAYLLAIWAFCSSPDYAAAVRRIDQALKVTNATLVKVPFDLAQWQKIAAEQYPKGLPEPYSDDLTQWLFHGHPTQGRRGTALHVAMARLCGYRWPAETDTKMHLSTEAREWIAKAASLPVADTDGLLCFPAVARERPLADRLRSFLSVAFGDDWSDALERQLVADADEVLDKRSARTGSLEAWLRDRAFRQHCALFHQRPFLWHIWDGQSDGFAALLNYHRLSRANLEKLTFSLLGHWIARMRDANDGRRLEAAQILQEKLQAILKGERPLDIFIRWKPIATQPIGWAPDLDDGVRLNIRPFVVAGVLRDTPNIHWRKDRGRDVPSAPWYHKFDGERINDHHLTIAEKEAARAAAATRAA